MSPKFLKFIVINNQSNYRSLGWFSFTAMVIEFASFDDMCDVVCFIKWKMPSTSSICCIFFWLINVFSPEVEEGWA